MQAINYSDFLERRYFSTIDALRCLSIILVVWYHTGHTVHVSSLEILNQGYLGVDIFFVISGFLITTLLLREQRANESINFRKFFARRALRIFPLYYATLLIYCVLVAFVEGQSAEATSFWKNLPYFVTYTSNIFVPLIDGRVIFYFSWSLAAEEQFYLVWPLLLKLFGINRTLIILCALILLTIFQNYLGGHATLSYLAATLNHIQIPLCLGALLALCLDNKSSFRFVRLLCNFKAAPAIYLVVFISLVQFNSGSKLAIGLSVTLLLASLVLTNNAATINNLNWKPYVHIGKISYGMYLLHMLSFNIVKMTLSFFNIEQSGLSVFLLTLAVVIPIATISYMTFERFFLNQKKRFQAT